MNTRSSLYRSREGIYPSPSKCVLMFWTVIYLFSKVTYNIHKHQGKGIYIITFLNIYIKYCSFRFSIVRTSSELLIPRLPFPLSVCSCPISLPGVSPGGVWVDYLFHSRSFWTWWVVIYVYWNESCWPWFYINIICIISRP